MQLDELKIISATLALVRQRRTGNYSSGRWGGDKKTNSCQEIWRVSCVIDTNIDTRARIRRAPIHSGQAEEHGKQINAFAVSGGETKSVSNAIKSRLVGDTEKGLHARIRFACIQNNALIREVDDEDVATSSGRP